MKGYKIGINKNLLDFVLIELEVPEEYPGRIYDKKLFGLIKCYEFDYSDPKSSHLGSCYSFQTDKTIGDSLTVVGFVIYNDTYFEVYSKPF